MVDKLLLGVIAAAAIAFFQNRLQVSQARLEKAKHIAEISIDRPVAVVTQLPAHLDAFILYAEHIRAHDIDQISSKELTDMQASISSDIEGSRAYYGDDALLKSWATTIKGTVTAVRAKALIKKSLGEDDFENLEKTRELAYRFHRRVIDLSVQQALE